MPNGFYHLIITQAFTDGTQVVLNRGVYVGPYSQATRVQMVVEPNLIHSEGTVQISAVVRKETPCRAPGPSGFTP